MNKNRRRHLFLQRKPLPASRVFDGQSLTCDTCVKKQLLCEGYNSQTPTRPKDTSTPQLQGNQYPREDTPHHDSQVDSLEHVVEGDTAADHYEPSGQQQSVSAANEGSPWISSIGSWFNPGSPSFVSGQDTSNGGGVLTAANRLPLPINPDTGPQVILTIHHILNEQFVP
ncbi:hypothetical protein P170DRAFT_475101 [Aspergillus steynii IBT 23096]|uniref:Uncharacterized protein n=1 Tax=Aspergillus steynii IBT 23096 TaxID=1392250 RepID=A0A2I2G7B0_9EURO|nr:uncharacterized protein P170DRAFT_475101 [Aspergillus steynii IBT 23096]PLB48760.1 hypothetical protein P170DRAFT_475101 [Aspergillus steynii IBT 23096]